MYKSFKTSNYKFINKDVVTEYIVLNIDYSNNTNQ